MQTVVYRKMATSPWRQALPPHAARTHAPPVPPHLRPLSPELFYPLVEAQEHAMWTYWLPTISVFQGTPPCTPAVIRSALIALQAPRDVLDEFHWAWNTALFDAYAIRTPARRDAQDPLLLGRQGAQWYRLALWGESLLPLDDIAALVHKSLVIKARASRWRVILSATGAVAGLLFGYAVMQFPSHGSFLPMLLYCGLFGLFCAWFPTCLHTPENRQHNFLDRYRC